MKSLWHPAALKVRFNSIVSTYLLDNLFIIEFSSSLTFSLSQSKRSQNGADMKKHRHVPSEEGKIIFMAVKELTRYLLNQIGFDG